MPTFSPFPHCCLLIFNKTFLKRAYLVCKEEVLPLHLIHSYKVVLGETRVLTTVEMKCEALGDRLFELPALCHAGAHTKGTLHLFL